MQVVMWVVFAGSLCLAQVIASHRSSDRGKVVCAGVFEVRLPSELQVDSSGPDSDLTAHDSERTLRIHTAPLRSGRSPNGGSDDQVTVKFQGLSVTGVLDLPQYLPPSGEGETLGYRLRARAAVPKVKKLLVVTMDVSNPSPQEDEGLFEQVVRSIEIAKESGRAPSSRPSADDPDAGQTLDAGKP